METTRAGLRRLALFTRLGTFYALLIAIICGGVGGVAFAGKKPKPEIDTIDVDSSASAQLLTLLSKHHSIVPIVGPTSPAHLVPVLIGPDALDNQNTMVYLIQVYRAGWTVGIVDATQEQANRFEQLVEGEQVASCEPDTATDEFRIALYALQLSTSELPGQRARYCLPDLPDNHGKAERTEEKWLNARFGATPPQSSAELIRNDSKNLDELSQKIHCDWLYNFNNEGEIQQDTYITSLRSFDSLRDYYYVQDDGQFLPLYSHDKFNDQAMVFRTNFTPPSLTGESTNDLGTRVTKTEPDTTVSYVSSYTNSESTTISGSAGFSMVQGPNISAGASVTIGTSTTTTVPPITILNTSSLTGASAAWEFHTQRHPQRRVLYTFPMSFLWYIDRDGYPGDGNDVTELSTRVFATMHMPKYISYGARCEFPPPFPTFDVGAPEITGVEPKSAQANGGTFAILGSQMYPGIVSSVLLGGDALPVDNYAPISDREIDVVVPAGQTKGSTRVQVNTNFNGSILHSNNDITINIK